jgi:TPR repeat protein
MITLGRRNALKWTAYVCFLLLIVVGGARFGYEYFVDLKRRPLEDAEALYEMGRYSEALPVIKHYAALGDVSAKLDLMEMYAYGRGVPYNEQLAASLIREIWADHEKIAKSEFAIARSYLVAESRERNVERGIAWLKRASSSGSIEAQALLADAPKLNDISKKPTDLIEPSSR